MTIILLLIAAIVALAADSDGSRVLDATACDEENDQEARRHRDTGRWVA